MFTEEMKDDYETNGYLVVNDVFDAGELSRIRDQIDALLADPDNPPEGVTIGREGNTVADKERAEARDDAVRGAAFLVRFMPFFQEVARQANLLSCARGLLGSGVQVFRDQALFKPPHGQAKPLHQDQSYFCVEPENDLTTAWIALDDATLDNGCMRYVPGSHLHGVFPVDADPERPVHHIPRTGKVTLQPAVDCPVSAGSVIFHHGCTLHSSAENRSSTWRRALIFHYASAAARSEKETLNREISLPIDPI
ncbi:MAG: phytanoyl-CoA dioxygenase family protein [Candidatus Latescibacterota bacterium]|nr:phytanoyl-CoA dioxygenase family protein [Candidatus Latescibacterota bacterium]